MKELEQFMAEGAVHYGTAVQTIRRFEVELCKTLDGLLSNVIADERLAAMGEPTPLQSKRTSASAWICSSVRVALGGDASGTFLLGLWWDPEQTGHDCVIYAGFQEGPDWATKHVLKPEGGFTTYRDQGKWAYLIAPPSDEVSLEERAAAVLAEYLDAFDAARAVRAADGGTS